MKINQIASLIIFTIFIFSVTCISCEKSEERSFFHKVDPVKTIYATLVDNNGQFTTNQNAPYGYDISIDFPQNYPENSNNPIDVSKVKLFIEFNSGIELETKIPDIIDLSKPFIINIINADGTKEKITITANFLDDEELSNIFTISKGVNVASWLSTPKYQGNQRVAFFTEADVKLLSDLGFDHIRLCVDEVVLWDDAGTKNRQFGFDLLHNAIEWCYKHDLRVIVDLHITRNHRFTNVENDLFTDPAEADKFVALWDDLSDELSKYPNSLVAYELLNEPVSRDSKNWNRIAAKGIQAIRAKEADRTIIVGVSTTNSTNQFNVLELPSTHKILMTFHYYGPYLLTYYGAQSTTGGRTDIPIQYPGQLVPDEWISALPEAWQSTGKREYTKEYLEGRILLGINRARELNVPVFVGEFGTWYVTPEPARSNWYRDVVDILNKHNVPYTSWDYKGAGYSVVSENLELRYPEIIDILTGK